MWMRTLVVNVTWVIVALCISLHLTSYILNKSVERNGKEVVASGEVKRLMKYHGTETAFQDNGRVWFYDKKGRRCELKWKE